jgi:hypothetical protein
MRGQERTGEDRRGQERRGQERTGEDRRGEDRRGQDRTGEDGTGQDRTGQDRTGHDLPPHRACVTLPLASSPSSPSSPSSCQLQPPPATTGPLRSAPRTLVPCRWHDLSLRLQFHAATVPRPCRGCRREALSLVRTRRTQPSSRQFLWCNAHLRPRGHRAHKTVITMGGRQHEATRNARRTHHNLCEAQIQASKTCTAETFLHGHG